MQNTACAAGTLPGRRLQRSRSPAVARRSRPVATCSTSRRRSARSNASWSTSRRRSATRPDDVASEVVAERQAAATLGVGVGEGAEQRDLPTHHDGEELHERVVLAVVELAVPDDASGVCGPAPDAEQQRVQVRLGGLLGDAELVEPVPDGLDGILGQRADGVAEPAEPHDLGRPVDPRLVAPRGERRAVRRGGTPHRLALVEVGGRPRRTPGRPAGGTSRSRSWRSRPRRPWERSRTTGRARPRRRRSLGAQPAEQVARVGGRGVVQRGDRCVEVGTR